MSTASSREPPEAPAAASVLGIDAGGTGTRFVLRLADGQVLAEGRAPALSGTQLFDAAGEAAADVVLGGIARALPVLPQAVVAGITGYDQALARKMVPRLMQIFGTNEACTQAMSDIELLCHAAFAGDGIVVYAGTGSVAALVDAMGHLHRAGGRGALVDDAGSGHWIAREALRQVWRAEDEEPGAWQRSLLAHALFEHVGGNEWAHTRQWVYGASRGELGALATVVAASAGKDAEALALLEQAGRELARLAQVLLRRYGRLPVAMAGRVFELHPAIERAFAAALPAGCEVEHLQEESHVAAARMALRLLARAVGAAGSTGTPGAQGAQGGPGGPGGPDVPGTPPEQPAVGSALASLA
ncbi:MAG: ATPase [Rubrivivax sp.]|nr:ATPase [Rubrivivax sp.]